MRTSLSCAEIDELDAAYALGALDPAEERAISEHLASCSQPHAQLRELAAAAMALPESLEPVEPHPRTRERLLATVTATPQDPSEAASVPTAAVPVRAAQPRGAALPTWLARLRPRLAPALAGAAVLALVLLGGWNLQLRSELEARDAALRAAATAIAESRAAHRVDGTGGTGYLVEADDGSATAIVAGVERLEPGEVYAMWLIADAAPVLAGTFAPQRDDEIVVARLDRPVSDYQTFAVTVESGVPAAPTRDPIMVSDLTDGG